MKNQVYNLIERNDTLRDFLTCVLFEEQPWMIPDTSLKNPERLSFREDKCLSTQYFGTGREGSNYAVEDKSLYFKDPRFKIAFNRAVEITINHLHSLKMK